MEQRREWGVAADGYFPSSSPFSFQGTFPLILPRSGWGPRDPVLMGKSRHLFLSFTNIIRKSWLSCIRNDQISKCLIDLLYLRKSMVLKVKLAPILFKREFSVTLFSRLTQHLFQTYTS